jgi:hypothetical protein
MNMCGINMHFQGSNAIHLIIFDESLMQNKVMVRSNVTNFLWNWSIDDAIDICGFLISTGNCH